MRGFMSKLVASAALFLTFVGGAFATPLLELPSDDTVHMLEITFDTDCKLSVVTLDGKQVRISSNKGHNLSFIAKRTEGQPSVAIHKVNTHIYQRNGVDVEGLKASKPFIAGAELSDEMKAAGVVSIKYVKSMPRKEWIELKKPRASSEYGPSKILSATGSDVPLNQRPGYRNVGDDDDLACCMTPGCNGVMWRVCGPRWSPPCGGDDCGWCCA
ncbi:hypothetical protein WDZ92_32985 [Nostoc sp. NIES-2111]